MIQLFENNNNVATTSRNIAEVFGKEHCDVLKAIRNIECPQYFRDGNFTVSSYVSLQGKEQPEYIITRDGFTLLVMGFTGLKAAEFKVKYIEAFNKMEKELRDRWLYFIPKTYTEALETAANLAKKAVVLQAKVEEDKTKVMFAEAVSASPSSISISDFAKILRQNGIKIGGKRLFEILRRRGYLVKSGISKNSPMQRYMELGLFEIKQVAVTVAGGVILSRSTKLTGKGQVYFMEMFLREQAE